MKTIFHNLQTLVTTISVGCLIMVLIMFLSLCQPNGHIAAGGCTVPDGICNTTIDL